MRPKIASSTKREKTKKRNHDHWLKHGHYIMTQRNLKKVELKELQLLSRDQIQTNNLEINDPLNSLSINGSINTSNKDLFDNKLNEEEFMHKYLIDYDEDDYDQSQDILDDDEESSEEENFEENLTEQQVEFANEFLSEETLKKTVREYDELVNIWSLNMLMYIFFTILGYFRSIFDD
jgi:hypothetical protein